MRYKYSILILSVLFVIGFYSCKKSDSNTNENQPQTPSVATYYPGNVGSKFSYSNDQGNGVRILSFTSTKSINNVNYITQNSFSLIGIDTVNATTYFRRSDTGLYFYVDTTGLMSFFPDSLRSMLTFNIDNEINAFNVLSLDPTKPWTAYQLNVKFAGIANVNIITLTGNYTGDESVSLNLTSGAKNVTAKKIRYDFKLTVPNLSNLSQPATSTFSAFLWFAPDIGIVKFQGNGAVIGALSGGNLTLGDTTKVITQNITSYDIK